MVKEEFRLEEKDAYVNKQNEINIKLKQVTFLDTFKPIEINDHSLTWRVTCKKREYQDKKSKFKKILQKCTNEQKEEKISKKIEPETDKINIYKDLSMSVGMGIYRILLWYHTHAHTLDKEASTKSIFILEQNEREDRDKNPPEWYFKLKDGTLHTGFTQTHNATLNRKFEEFINNPNQYNANIKDSTISVRGIKYDQVNFNKKYKYGDIEVGELINSDGSQVDNPNLGSKLVRIVTRKVLGKEQEVEYFIDRFYAFYKSRINHEIPILEPMIFDTLIMMNKEDIANLFIQLVFEAGTVLRIKEGRNLITLAGVYPNKALSLIYFHPFVQLKIRQQKSIYPFSWNPTIINQGRGWNDGREDRVGKAYKLPLMTDEIISLQREGEEFNKVEEYFFRNMDKKKFEITDINRIQHPFQYKTYYFNREHFIQKFLVVNLRKNNPQNEIINKTRMTEEQKRKEAEEKLIRTQQELEEEKEIRKQQLEIYKTYSPFGDHNDTEQSLHFDEDLEAEGEEEKIEYQSKHKNEYHIDSCNIGEKFLFYVPRTTLKKKTNDDVIQEYQTIDECIEEKGILPIHTKNAEIEYPDWKITQGHQVRSKDNKKKQDNDINTGRKGKYARVKNSDDDSDNSEDEENSQDDNFNKQLDYDKMTIFGDDAAYFTINNNPENPTVLYSHNEACKDFSLKSSKGHGYRQLLCKVITGIEADYSQQITTDIYKDNELKKIEEMIKDGKYNELRMPKFPATDTNKTFMPD